MDNSEKMATYGTKTKANKAKTQYICVEHHYAQTNTNKVSKTWALLQTTGGKSLGGRF